MIGLFAGIGLAKGMVALFAALDVELPDAATVIAPRTIVLSILVGTITTLVASILPAKRATRVPPIAAVREGSTLPASRYAHHTPKAGVVVATVSLAALLTGLFAGGLGTLGLVVLLGGGVLGVFLGMALLAPRLVTPLARLVGWPARRRGIAGELAGANAVRNPGRTASTAAALMIGLTLVTLVAVLASSLSTASTAALKEEVHAGYIIDGKDGLPFRAAEGDALAQRAGCQERLARPLRHGAHRRQGAHDHGHRPGHDRALLHVQVGQGLRAGARHPRDRRRDREEGLRRGPPPGHRQHLHHHDAHRRQARRWSCAASTRTRRSCWVTSA